MNSDLERTIIHYYPQRALISPLENDGVSWDYDPSYGTLKQILADLKSVDPSTRPGTRGRYDISEELVLKESIRLQLCYLGPYAALNYGLERELDEDERELVRRVERVLEKYGVMLLDEGDLEETVPWIQQGAMGATVWNCLFVHPEG
jgi:hypothetical protein